MSIESQHLAIERVRREVSAWQTRQPDFGWRLTRVARHWLGPALRALDTDERALVAALTTRPAPHRCAIC